MKKILPPKFYPQRGVKNILKAKNSSRIVYVDSSLPFSRKKKSIKISPPNANPQKRVKKVMKAKIPSEIVFVVPFKPLLRIKKIHPQLLTPEME